MSAVDDLVAWLGPQVDEDERKVTAMEREEKRVQTAPIFGSHPPNWLAGVDIFVSSKRWRAEVEAKRQIIDQHPADDDGFCGDGIGLVGCKWAYPCPTLRLLAVVYADRPGYQDEWRPA
jgi:hypothetical protein